MKRSKFSLSHYKLASGNPGQLIPVGCIDVLPGDTFDHSASFLIRVSPLLAPVMHPVQVRIHHFFVPYRLLFPQWEEFITGQSAVPLPTLSVQAGGQSANRLIDYLGIPTERSGVNFLDFAVRAYNRIWNEYYRDQDLDTPRTDTDVSMARVAWGKDYFTTARPWPQKGGNVVLPLGTSAPVISAGDGVPLFKVGTPASVSMGFVGGAGSVNTWSTPPATASQASWVNPKLQADLSAASSVNVRDVRLAFALQRYNEARAKYGSRYSEYLAYLGVKSSDARLQRPEYLGGGKQYLNFSEVLQTAEGSEPVGTLRGHGISAMRSQRYRRFFEEHGVVLSLLSVRPKSIYMDGMKRQFLKKNKEDFFQKELEFIGQQAILNNEVYTQSGSPGLATFGYGNRYQEYREEPSGVSGQFRNILNFWHMGRSFASAPALNSTFIQCNPADRIYAVPTEDQLWMMIQHNCVARRIVSRSTASKVI